MKPGLPLTFRQQHLPKMAPHPRSMMGVRSMDIFFIKISTGKSRGCLDAEFLELMDQCLFDAKPREACSAEHTKACAFIHISHISL